MGERSATHNEVSTMGQEHLSIPALTVSSCRCCPAGQCRCILRRCNKLEQVCNTNYLHTLQAMYTPLYTRLKWMRMHLEQTDMAGNTLWNGLKG